MSFFAFMGALEQGLVFGLMALGVYLTFRILDFPDLTVDGSFPMGAAVSSVMILNGQNPWLALALASIAGAGAGMITAVLNVRLKILNLLASIITMIGVYSINIRIMGRPNLSLLGEDTIFTPLKGFLPPYLMVPLVFLVILILVLIALNWFLSTEIGLALRATGDNERVSRAMGIQTGAMVILGLAISNGLVALSGGLYSQAQGSADIGMGVGMIVAGLASVIVGEAFMRGRRASVLAASICVVLGSIVYRLAIGFALTLNSGSWLSIRPSDLNFMTAALVVIFLSLPQFRLRGKRK